MKASNVETVGFDEEMIKTVVKKQIDAGRYDKSDMYFGEGNSQKTAEKLATLPLYIQKKFTD